MARPPSLLSDALLRQLMAAGQTDVVIGIPTLNNADPPRHGPMRKSVLTCMTPRRLNALEPVLRDYAQNLVLSFRDRLVVDFVEEFAFPFPGFAAFSLLGFPEADTEDEPPGRQPGDGDRHLVGAAQ